MGPDLTFLLIMHREGLDKPAVGLGLLEPLEPGVGVPLPVEPDAGLALPVEPDAGLALPVEPDAGLALPVEPDEPLEPLPMLALISKMADLISLDTASSDLFKILQVNLPGA